MATNLAVSAHGVIERRRGLTHHRAIRRSGQHLWRSTGGWSAARGGHARTGRGTTGLTTAGQSTVGTHGGTGHRHQREQNGLCHDTFLLNLNRDHELHQETWTPSPELDGLKMVGLRRTHPARPACKGTHSRQMGHTPTSPSRGREWQSCEAPSQSRGTTRTMIETSQQQASFRGDTS